MEARARMEARPRPAVGDFLRSVSKPRPSSSRVRRKWPSSSAETERRTRRAAAWRQTLLTASWTMR
jgi:hypothetical protein